MNSGVRTQPSTAPERSRTNSRGEKQCYRCHGWGHVSYNCPQAKATPGPNAQPKALYGGVCEKFSDCASLVRAGRLDGSPVEMLVDTGCDRTMVSQELVDPAKVDQTKKA